MPFQVTATVPAGERLVRLLRGRGADGQPRSLGARLDRAAEPGFQRPASFLVGSFPE
ncbi:hypothetical protein J4G37_22215 [Microvirga sp. 3-52]|nr:hypothetical protein [Microvirga sp. 3-52]